jgi:hypothetical protein
MAVIVDTIDQVWLNIRSAGGSNKESATNFRKVYEQAVDNEDFMYMRLTDGVNVENLGDDIPLSVTYFAKVWFGAEYEDEATHVYDDILVEVMPPKRFWQQDKTFDQWRDVPIFNVGLCDDPDHVFKLYPSWIEDCDIDDDSDEYYMDWFITYLADTDKVKIITPEEVILSVKTTWIDENHTEQQVMEDFKKAYDRAVEEDLNLYVTLDGYADVETHSSNLPSFVRYPVKVRLGRKGEKAKEYVDAMLQVSLPEELWNPKAGFPVGRAVPMMNVELKDVDDNVIVLEPGNIVADFYREEQEFDGEYQDWNVTYRVHTSN